jgi:tRNA dimethylallyltransferase
VNRGVLILAGPTASGKTDLAIELAKDVDGEIIGADSRQIYCDMPVGTAAPTGAQLRDVPHHLIGFLDPRDRYSAAAFVRDALASIVDVIARGKQPIVAGGTGFYIRALAGDVALAGARNEHLRTRLAHESQLHPPEVMHAWLAALEPARARALAPEDRYRVARALEIALAERSERAPTEIERRSLRSENIPYAKLFLDVPIGVLETRIAARVDAMLQAGLLEEAERLGETAVAADAVGYPQANAYLRGHSTRDELRMQLVRATRRYAKRQETWFRSEPDVERVLPERAREIARARMKAWE